jgi:clathrin light chain A
MDPFEEFESQNRNVSVDDADPAAEFLAREQAEFDLIEKGTNSLSLEGIDKSASNSSLDMKHSSNPYDAVQQIDRQINEPEKIKRWREEQRQRIETKDAEEERKKKEWKEKAKKDLEDWYKNRNEQLVISIQNNRFV